MKKILSMILMVCLVFSISMNISAKNRVKINDDEKIIRIKIRGDVGNQRATANLVVGSEGEYEYSIETNGALEKYVEEDSELKDIKIEKEMRFESSDPSILEVTKDGKFKALKEGKVVVSYSAFYSEETIKAIGEIKKDEKINLVYSEYASVYRYGNYSSFGFNHDLSMLEDANGYGMMTVYVYNEAKNVYRLYNKNNGVHFYTSKLGERNNLISLGWKEEKGWIMPNLSNYPVHRLYNKNNGMHHYTTKIGEKDKLVSLGWTYEGIAFYSASVNGDSIYRNYFEDAKNGIHLYTKSITESNNTIANGWKAEGIGWYCIPDAIINNK